MRTFIAIAFLIFLTGCRSHKESALAESSFVEVNSTAQIDEKIKQVRFSNLLSSLSFDSIEIIIQRNWNLPGESDVNLSNVWAEKPDVEFMATPDSMRVSSKSTLMAARSEFIGIRAYNAKEVTSHSSRDSASSVADFSLAMDLSADVQKEEAVSSDSIAVVDPPNLTSVLIWSFIIAAAIICIVYCLKRWIIH